MEHQSALDRFKDTPELIPLVASYLDQEDIISLQVTSRKMYSHTHPLYYRRVYLDRSSSLSNLRQAAIHARYISSLTVEEEIRGFYYSAIAEVFKDPATRSSLEHSRYKTCSPISSTSSPSLPNHAQLDSVLSEDTLLKICESSDNFIPRLFYVVRFSPFLTSLTLFDINIELVEQLNFLGRILSGIGTLESLTLEFSSEVPAGTFLTTIIHSCPPLVKSLSLDINNPLDITSTLEYSREDAIAEVPAEVSGPLENRRTPLTRLTSLECFSHDWVDGEEYMSILEFLPALETINIPAIDSVYRAALRFAECCPRLKNLFQSGSSPDKRGNMALQLLQALPENTVESFSFIRVQELPSSRNLLGLDSHFLSLKNISFDPCCRVNQATVNAILFQCPELEVFKITSYAHSNFEITLQGIVKKPWASTKFKELRLVLTLHELAKLPMDFYPEEDMTPSGEKRLSKFYQQLGALRELRVLDLKVDFDKGCMYDDDEPVEYYHYSFPGMLTLEDRRRYRKGWLELLGGLENLEELRGSFNLEAMLEGFEFGQAEAYWIGENWPKLKVIELFTKRRAKKAKRMMPQMAQYLQHKLPGLQVSIY